ncbi:MAG: hypothetical protein NC489_39155 [Ruminococcus flavefaciens]|nr:hypothetical protein [Ruminococcus flavefaciens]
MERQDVPFSFFVACVAICFSVYIAILAADIYAFLGNAGACSMCIDLGFCAWAAAFAFCFIFGWFGIATNMALQFELLGIGVMLNIRDAAVREKAFQAAVAAAIVTLLASYVYRKCLNAAYGGGDSKEDKR